MDVSQMSRKVLGSIVSAFLSAVVLTACATAPSSAQSPAVMQPTQQSTAPASTQGDQIYEYKLGSGDKVRIIVFGEKDLSGEFVVSGEGKVSFPLIGEVQASGATASALQDKIGAALKAGYLQDPKVNVEVLTFRPFYILGEVAKPGEYPFSNGMTIERAVATASGYTYRADHKKVFIKHANQDREEAVPLTAPIMIAPGDTIRIPERYF